MKRKISLVLVILFLTIALLSGKGNQEEKLERTKPLLAVSILPHQYVVNRIGGERVDSVVLVGEGQNPHNYEINPRQMALLSEADAWILSNVDFEIALLPKISSLYPKLPIVDGTAGVVFRSIEEHGDDDHHHHAGEIDRHSWLGREPIKILAHHIEATLSEINPSDSPYYKSNLEHFLSDVDNLFDSLKARLRPLEGSTVLVYHPSFGYLFDELGLVQKAIETGGKEPTAKNLTAIIEEAQRGGIKAIFVQAQFPLSAAKNIAQAIGAEVLPLDPLAYEWLHNIEQIGNTLLTVLDGGKL